MLEPDLDAGDNSDLGDNTDTGTGDDAPTSDSADSSDDDDGQGGGVDGTESETGVDGSGGNDDPTSRTSVSGGGCDCTSAQQQSPIELIGLALFLLAAGLVTRLRPIVCRQR
jgi:hypothetical protein